MADLRFNTSAVLRDDFSLGENLLGRGQIQIHGCMGRGGDQGKGGGGGVDGIRQRSLQTTNLSGKINCFFMRATKERSEVVSRPFAAKSET